MSSAFQKISPIFFAIAIVFTFLIKVLFKTILDDYDNYLTQIIVINLQNAIYAFWLLALTSFFKAKMTKKAPYALLIYVSILVNLGINIYFSLYNYSSYFIASMLIHSVTAFFVTLQIKKVFFERSFWFIFVETFFIPLGLFTLSPEIERVIKSSKESSQELIDDY